MQSHWIAQVRSRQTFAIAADALDLQACYESGYGQIRHDVCTEMIASARAVIAGYDHLAKSCGEADRISTLNACIGTSQCKLGVRGGEARTENPSAAPDLHDRAFRAMAAFAGTAKTRHPRAPQRYLSNAETLNAAMGLRNPLSESWPAGSVAAKLSTIVCTLESIKI
jgi:hypothetical protein